MRKIRLVELFNKYDLTIKEILYIINDIDVDVDEKIKQEIKSYDFTEYKNKKNNITITELAKFCCVSTATISRAINSNVENKKTFTILMEIENSGYYPSLKASQMGSNNNMEFTIEDVAKFAGVSIATVSRVNNGGSVSEKSKVKVLEAQEKLNYISKYDYKEMSGREKREVEEKIGVSNEKLKSLFEF